MLLECRLLECRLVYFYLPNRPHYVAFPHVFSSSSLYLIFSGSFDCWDCPCVPCWGGVPASCTDLLRTHSCLFQTNLDLKLDLSLLISQVRVLPAWKCSLNFIPIRDQAWRLDFSPVTSLFPSFMAYAMNEIPCSFPA